MKTMNGVHLQPCPRASAKTCKVGLQTLSNGKLKGADKKTAQFGRIAPFYKLPKGMTA